MMKNTHASLSPVTSNHVLAVVLILIELSSDLSQSFSGPSSSFSGGSTALLFR